MWWTERVWPPRVNNQCVCGVRGRRAVCRCVDNLTVDRWSHTRCGRRNAFFFYTLPVIHSTAYLKHFRFNCTVQRNLKIWPKSAVNSSTYWVVHGGLKESSIPIIAVDGIFIHSNGSIFVFKNWDICRTWILCWHARTCWHRFSWRCLPNNGAHSQY